MRAYLGSSFFVSKYNTLVAHCAFSMQRDKNYAEFWLTQRPQELTDALHVLSKSSDPPPADTRFQKPDGSVQQPAEGRDDSTTPQQKGTYA